MKKKKQAKKQTIERDSDKQVTIQEKKRKIEKKKREEREQINLQSRHEK